jgi:uncharacterized protein (DUF2141 family)
MIHSILFLLIGFFAQSSNSKELHLTIENLKNNQGVVRLLLFDQEAGFPKDPEKAIRRETLKIQNQKATIVIKDLPSGKYAISVFHDSQNTGKIRTNAFGVPIDSYGFSNNASGTMGPPSFTKAAFEVNQAKTTHIIKLR